jgi:hypothetical protein
MDRAADKDLYRDVLQDAKEKFERFPSAYASMWIQREYQRLGGEYLSKSDGSLSSWRQSKWVQVLPLLKEGKVIVCGDDNKETKACRPSVRVDESTPITIQELLKIHNVKDIIKAAEKKNNDMEGRLYWKELRFVPSKK